MAVCCFWPLAVNLGLVDVRQRFERLMRRALVCGVCRFWPCVYVTLRRVRVDRSEGDNQAW
ncbi:MAG: hypothetical protein WCS28_02405 [Thiomicrospira sp.]